MNFFNAKPYYDTEPIRELMLGALPHPNEEILDRLLDRYHNDDDMRLIGAIDDEENILGIIGLKIDDLGTATVLHLHVHDVGKHKEIGGALVQKAIKTLGLRKLSARSTESMLPFYDGLGFVSWVIGEKPPGTKWYGVRWEVTPHSN